MSDLGLEKKEGDKLQNPNHSEKFIGQKLSIDQMPDAFSFQSDEIRYGLNALSKWSTEAGGKETAGVIYLDPDENLKFKHLSIGSDSEVAIPILDLGNLNPEDINDKLKANFTTVSVKSKLVHVSSRNFANEFVLLPREYSEDLPLTKGVVFEKGKKVCGSVHVHPSGNPPNGLDLAILLSSVEEDSMKGVIAGNHCFIMVTSFDTPNLVIETTQQGKSTTMHDYGDKINSETIRMIADGAPLTSALTQILIKHCRLNKIALYDGNLETNEYKRID